MSLLQTLSYKEYKEATNFSSQLCDIIAKIAKLSIPFEESPKKPGELLLKTLDRRGYSVQNYRDVLATALSTKIIHTYYKPQIKLAILIGNDKYLHLTKLVTPSVDCDSLGSRLKTLGFIVVKIKNMESIHLKSLLENLFEGIPKDSYCFIFYAGHGCQIGNVKCMLNVDCPTEDIDVDHCLSENYILKQVTKCKSELCVFIMDMCRLHLDKSANSKIYSSLATENMPDFNTNGIFLVSYSTQSSEAAYEVLQIECSTTMDNATYELKTGDTAKIVPGASQYVTALCTLLTENLDVSSLLDKVHADMENSLRKQRPIKMQCGVSKRSLYDPAIGDTEEMIIRIKEMIENYKENCTVY